jgi:hypothetical protein
MMGATLLPSSSLLLVLASLKAIFTVKNVYIMLYLAFSSRALHRQP